MILGLGEPWAPDVVPFPSGATPEENAAAFNAIAVAASQAAAKKKKQNAAAAAAKPAAAAPAAGMIEQIKTAAAAVPWLPVGLLAVGVVGAIYLYAKAPKPKRRNPSADCDGDEDDDGGDEDEEKERAVSFYKDFHWGRKPKRIKRTSLSPSPRSLVQLGTLEAVTYSARKGAEKLADYIHHFGEGGTKKPKLAADPRTRRLHVVGGGYNIKAAGITG